MKDAIVSGATRRTRWGAGTRTCTRREHNEDAFRVFADAEVFVVADGSGGRAAGGTAADLSIACFEDLTADRGPYEPLAAAVIRANQLVFERAQEDIAATGMGCALAVVGIHQQWLSIVHVGDCRVGRLEHDDVVWLTTDHALWLDMMRAGKPIGEIEHIQSFHASVITRAIGTQEQMDDVDVSYHRIAAGELMLLCSDGLWRTVPPRAIWRIVHDGSKTLAARCEALLAAADEAGGPDNATVLLVEITAD